MLAQRLHLQGLVAQMEAYWAANVGGLNDLVRCVHAAVEALSYFVCCAGYIHFFFTSSSDPAQSQSSPVFYMHVRSARTVFASNDPATVPASTALHAVQARC